MDGRNILSILGGIAVNQIRWRMVGAASFLATVMIAPAAHSAPAGCDYTRPGVTHGANGASPSPANIVPCLTLAFAGFGEAIPVVTSSGAVMYGSAYDTSAGIAGTSGGLARTVDEGAHWEHMTLPPRSVPPEAVRGAGDPQLWRDPLTNRIYYTNIGGAGPSGIEYALCQTDLSFSDDDGATWTNNPDPAAWGCPAFDFPRPFTGPPRTSAMTTSYPNVLYICKSSHGMPDRQCWKSLDGGSTFTEIPNSGQYAPWTASRTGFIYGVSAGFLHTSADEGATWVHRPVPTGGGGLGLGIGGGIAVDRDGNLYLVGTTSNGLPQVTYSTDQGAHWSTPLAVQMPGLGHVHQPAIAVGEPGRVAVVYIGNGDASDSTKVPPYQVGGPHHGYLTMTGNIFAPAPVFQSVQVDSNVDPLLPYGFPAGAVPPGLPNTSTSPSRADYIGVDFGPDGITPWAYFFKDLCSAPTVCTGPEPAKVNYLTNWMGAVATIANVP